MDLTSTKTKKHHHEEPLSEETCIKTKLTDVGHKKKDLLSSNSYVDCFTFQMQYSNILGVEINNRALRIPKP